jgi:glucose-6-phosphate isomerase
MSLTDKPEWKALAAHYEKVRGLHLRALFAKDTKRGERLTAEGAGLYFDYSKHRITDETMALLLKLASACGLEERRAAMFHGDKINVTEKRAVLHVALRAPRGRRFASTARTSSPRCTPSSIAWRRSPNASARGVDGAHREEHPQRRQRRHRRLRPRAGDGLRGAAPLQRARHDVPLRVERRRHRLRRGHPRSRSRRDAVDHLLEDVHHARDDDQRRTARGSGAGALRDDGAIAKHFVAVSTNAEEVSKFGIDTANMFGFWDWVGRPLLDGFGDRPVDDARDRPEPSASMLAGFHAMDEHFRSAPMEQNLPVLMGLLSVWYGDFFGARRSRCSPTISTSSASRLSPAAHDGEQRQAHDARRRDSSTTRPARSSGASRAPTGSTRSTS